MPDTLISNYSAYVASLRCCPSCPDQLSALAGMRSQRASLMTANLHNLEIAQAAGHGKESIYTQFLTANANPGAGKPERQEGRACRCLIVPRRSRCLTVSYRPRSVRDAEGRPALTSQSSVLDGRAVEAVVRFGRVYDATLADKREWRLGIRAVDLPR